jgi:sulfur relay (sulfurtransferase) DsrF/TusC family protein
MKKITVIVRNLPLNTRRNSEALRMSVGVTLRNDKVTVIFMDDGVYSATPLEPDKVNSRSSDKEFEALSMLGCSLLADKPSLDKRSVKSLRENVVAATREELVDRITESDIVIPF